MAFYDVLFAQKGISVSQILITDNDFRVKAPCYSSSVTLHLLDMGISVVWFLVF